MRLCRVGFTPQFLLGLISEGGTRAAVCRGVPADAQYRGAFVDPQTNTVSLMLEHESFVDVPDGNAAPTLTVTMMVYSPPEDGVWGEIKRALETCFPERADAILREAFRGASK